jgi:hypothetical protein
VGLPSGRLGGRHKSAAPPQPHPGAARPPGSDRRRAKAIYVDRPDWACGYRASKRIGQRQGHCTGGTAGPPPGVWTTPGC